MLREQIVQICKSHEIVFRKIYFCLERMFEKNKISFSFNDQADNLLEAVYFFSNVF